MAAISTLLLIAATCFLVPTSILFLECLASLLPDRRWQGKSLGPRTSIAVLIPAHNEERLLGRTLDSVRKQLSESDRLIVVADNCADRTAELARSAGATVVERRDLARRGKGFALDYGLRFLRQDPPDVVIIVDADCQVGDGCIERLAAVASQRNRPVQGNYTLIAPTGASVLRRISAFAFLVKNVVRPLGLSRLGGPCLLTGSGMAFPWPLIRRLPLGSDNIVEDMQTGIDAVLLGFPPVFCPSARITGSLPAESDAARPQRRRWEHGHLSTLLRQGPRLVCSAMRQGDMQILLLALELCVPPLSLLVLMLLVATILAASAIRLGPHYFCLFLLGMSWVLLASAVFTAWLRHGRALVPFKTLLAAPVYVASKLPVYLLFLLKREREWIRTNRTHDQL